MTPQPMPDQPPTPISYNEPQTPQPAPQSPMTNQLSQHHQRSAPLNPAQNTPNARMTLRERKEPPTSQPGYQVLEPVEQMNQAGRRRKIRRQLIIDQVGIINI